MNRESFKPSLALGIAVVMALVVITALQQRARRKLVQRIPDRELSIISHWEQAEFTGLAELLRHPEILDDIATTNRTPITSRQSRALKDSILAGLVAFSRGSYEDFKAFVCPVPLPLTTNRLESMRRFLRDPFAFPTIGRKPEIREPRSIMRILDHGTPEEVHRAYFRVMSAYTDYKDYWQAVAISRSWLRTFSADSLPSDLMDLMFERMENVGAFQAIPTYDCASKARQCLERNPFLVCADVCLLVKRRPPDPVAPFVIRFFWAPEDEVWIPYALGMASTYAETAIQPML